MAKQIKFPESDEATKRGWKVEEEKRLAILEPVSVKLWQLHDPRHIAAVAGYIDAFIEIERWGGE